MVDRGIFPVCACALRRASALAAWPQGGRRTDPPQGGPAGQHQATRPRAVRAVTGAAAGRRRQRQPGLGSPKASKSLAKRGPHANAAAGPPRSVAAGSPQPAATTPGVDSLPAFDDDGPSYNLGAARPLQIPPAQLPPSLLLPMQRQQQLQPSRPPPRYPSGSHDPASAFQVFQLPGQPPDLAAATASLGASAAATTSLLTEGGSRIPVTAAAAVDGPTAAAPLPPMPLHHPQPLTAAPAPAMAGAR